MKLKIAVIANSEEEALTKASEMLRLPEDKIFIHVLGEVEKGLNCEAFVDIDLALEGRRYIENILKAMHIGYQIETRTVKEETEIHYLIECSENALLIGHGGKTLEALQTLVRYLISNYSKERHIITLDIGDYREARDRQLEILATKTASEVIKTKIAVKLTPMNAYERHVIHEKLANWRDVYTESEGEGKDRAVVIKPKI